MERNSPALVGRLAVELVLEGDDLVLQEQLLLLESVQLLVFEDPAFFHSRYRGVQVVLKSGQTVTGIRLNRDDLSIQLRDTRDNLRSFLVENVKEIRFDKPSLMPAYASMDRKDLEDVVAFLNSLKGEQ